MRSLLYVVAVSALSASTAAHFGVIGSQAGTAKASFIDSTKKEIGTATLTDTPKGLKITGKVTGLSAGVHGMHVHAVGKCEPPFTTAGGHFNPDNKQHGTANPMGPHAGDLPNITVAAGGTFEVVAPGLKLATILDADGAALIIHATADDYKTDPSGNSGARVACGVITK